jgi:uncharacterized protein YoxC
MPVVMQICLVIVTLALVTVAVVALKLMARFQELGDQISSSVASLQSTMNESRQSLAEARNFVARLEEIADDVRTVSTRFERIGHRAADLTTALMTEVEQPVMSAISIARGVRKGASVLLERWSRGQHTTSHHNGGFENE